MKKVAVLLAVLMLFSLIAACTDVGTLPKDVEETREETRAPTPEPTSEPTPKPTPTPYPHPMTEYTEMGCITLSVPTQWERASLQYKDTIYFQFDDGHLMVQAEPEDFGEDWWNAWLQTQEGGIFEGEYVNQQSMLIDGVDAMFAQSKLVHESDEYYETLVAFVYEGILFTVSLFNEELPVAGEYFEAFDQIMASIKLSGEYQTSMSLVFSGEYDDMAMLSPLILASLPIEFEIVEVNQDDETEEVEIVFAAHNSTFVIVAYSYPNESGEIPDALEMNKILESSLNEHLSDQGFAHGNIVDKELSDGSAYLSMKATFDNGTEYFWFEYQVYEPRFVCNVWFAGPYESYDECREIFSTMMNTLRLSFVEE